MSKYFPTQYVIITLALFVAVSLFIRSYLPFNQVFTSEGVKFTANDAYYHMRLVDNLVHNFPKLTFYDQFYITPGISTTLGSHFFDWLIASIAWVAGLGNYNEKIIDIVGAYVPAVMGALVVIPVYFIGKTLFNRTAGLIAAALIAVMPGEFLSRSILGGADHHVAEVLLSTTSIMFLILAVKNIEQKKSILYALASGLLLGLYLATWTGGLIFVLIVTLYFSIQIVINHLRGESSLRIGYISSLVFMVSATMSESEATPLVFLASVSIWLLVAISWLMRNMQPVYFPIVIVSGGIISLLVLRIALPDVVNPMLSNLVNVFHPSGSTGATTLELQPILSPNGKFTWNVALGNFTSTLYLFLIALAVLMYGFIKKPNLNLVLIVWTLIMLVLTITQRRYAYYFAVNAAILSGYLVAQIISWSAKFTRISPIAVSVLLLPVVFIPNIIASKAIASDPLFVPSDAWQSSLLWMRDNTPEPIDKDAYLAYYSGQIPYAKTPKASYGVTAWWDYGYWITRIAHRVPSANPGQSPEPIKKVAGLFLSQDDGSQIIGELGTKYIILDKPVVTSKFYALSDWAGQDNSKYLDAYYVSNPKTKRIEPVQIYYPEYYKTLSVRLFYFNGKEVSENPVVINYSNEIDNNGVHFKYIREGRQFTSYQLALEYVQGKENTLIVGTTPLVSPVKLEALPEFQLVHEDGEIKIFEYAR